MASTVAETNSPSNGAAVPGAQGDGQQQQAGGFSWKGLIVRMVVIYMVTSFFRKSTPVGDDANKSVAPASGGGGSAGAGTPASNLYSANFLYDVYMYMSEKETYTRFDSADLFWHLSGLRYGDWTGGPAGDGSYEHEDTFDTPASVRHRNGSLYLHVFVTPAGYGPDPRDRDNYQAKYTVRVAKRLNKYRRKKYARTQNLLTGKTDAHPDDIAKAEAGLKSEILSHWHPNLTVNIVDDHTPWVQGRVPQPLNEHIFFEPTTGQYYPVVYVNDYWNLNSDYAPINETVDTLTLRVTFSPLSLFRWQLYVSQGMSNKWSAMLGDVVGDTDAEDQDQDALKRAFLDTNPVLLGLTFVVSIVHSVFEFLAFKNDIQFWRERKSLEGLSVRSVFFNIFQCVVVLLYVLDNDTNTVVRISVFVGLCIEIWKVPKCVNVNVDRTRWRVWFSDKSTYTESATKQYDMLAFKYLSWLLFPLLAGYAVYALFYMEHKGWYSFTLNMMYGFLLTFGFIMMTPQLFINYKLKSVAHLPWRMLTYKALNTFIDDIFAFVIQMPTLYRLGCFRDDIVFFIFLYQKWIYPVDPTRVNEFGVSGEDLHAAHGAPVPVAETSGAAPPAVEGAEEPPPPPEETKKDK